MRCGVVQPAASGGTGEMMACPQSHELQSEVIAELETLGYKVKRVEGWHEERSQLRLRILRRRNSGANRPDGSIEPALRGRLPRLLLPKRHSRRD